VTGPIGRYLAQWINNDPVTQDLLVGVSAVMTHRDGVDVFIANDGANHRRWSKVFQQFGAQSDFAPVVRKYLDAFAEIAKSEKVAKSAKSEKHQDPMFEVVVRRAFAMARERSQAGSAVSENRVAILALGIALGTLKLDMYVGDVWQPGTLEYVADIQHQSRLRGRADWPRHFWVSAALTVMANSRVSDVLGLLKEELDAGQGGGGFSFGDLAADRAGTEFANAATQDARSAHTIQDWVLAEDTDLQELMPAADDLREGMSDEDMMRDFDGVDGTRYQQMVAEIQRRVMEQSWAKKTE
jgi:hypothetical protein